MECISGDNISWKIDRDQILVIKVDLKKHSGATKSGRSILIASTRGQYQMGKRDESFKYWYFGMSAWISGNAFRTVKKKQLRQDLYQQLLRTLDFIYP